ncbi:hypothetical protein D3C86_1554220 [compost metagenome]
MDIVLKFNVQGSVEEPYAVTFERIGAKLRAYCSCEAAERGLHCKHRINILKGDKKGIVSGNEADVPKVVSMLAGTKLEIIMKEVGALEDEAERIKKELKKSKEKLARWMDPPANY